MKNIYTFIICFSLIPYGEKATLSCAEQKSEQRKKAFQYPLECLFYIYYSFVSFAYRRIKL